MLCMHITLTCYSISYVMKMTLHRIIEYNIIPNLEISEHKMYHTHAYHHIIYKTYPGILRSGFTVLYS